jgi:hypothetical protein
VRQYLLKLTAQGVPHHHHMVRIELEKAENAIAQYSTAVVWPFSIT